MEDFEIFCRQAKNILYCTYGARFAGSDAEKMAAIGSLIYLWEEYKKDLVMCKRLGVSYVDYSAAKDPETNSNIQQIARS